MPHNFSQVDLSAMSDAEIGSKFPRFPVCTTCSCVTLWRVPFHSLPTFEANLHSLFPSIATAIQGRQAARVVDVHAGQALYLPAGWFHEVLARICVSGHSLRAVCICCPTCSTPCSTADRLAGFVWQVTSFSTKQQQGHMAFSYWFHPPDNLCPDASGLSQPYTLGFWPALWAARVPGVRPALRTQLNGTASSPPSDEEEHTAGAEPARGGTPAYLALPVYRLWWRHPSWIATCGRRRHQFLLMRRVRRRTS